MKKFLSFVIAVTVLLYPLLGGSICKAQEQQIGKTLIMYYSLTGNTRAGCEALQKELATDILEIRDLKKRAVKGLSFAFTAFASLLGRHTKIEPQHPDLSSYANIIIGSPIWTGKLSIAIRTLIDNNRFDGKKVVIYTTSNAYEKEEYRQKSMDQVSKAGGDVVGYYQVLSKDEVGEEKVQRPIEKVVADTLKYVPEIKKAFSPDKVLENILTVP